MWKLSKEIKGSTQSDGDEATAAGGCEMYCQDKVCDIRSMMEF